MILPSSMEMWDATIFIRPVLACEMLRLDSKPCISNWFV